jgi:hypothetical protein
MKTASNSRVLRTIPLLIAFCLVSLPAQAQYGGGTGEPNDPYQIATAEDLMLLGDSPEDYDKHFILTADIDLDPNLPGRKVFYEAVIAPDTDLNDDWSGFQGTPFTGVFEGNGHIISNLHIDGSVFLGLFGQLGDGYRAGEVTNLGVVDVNITGSGEYISGLVGFNVWSTVSNCHSTGIVNGDTFIGGLVGYNYGIVYNSYSIITVSGNDNVGGLVGSNGCEVNQSFSSGGVSGNKNVGGLVGINEASHTWWRLDSTIIKCYSTCNVTGIMSVGGLLGHNMDGRDDPYVGKCYSTGAVGGSDKVGGLIGFNNRIVTSSFWDIETSGQDISDGGIGKTTAEMQDPNTFMTAGWDFICEPDTSYDIWAEPEGGGYPVLFWQVPPEFGLPDFAGGKGEPNDPYLISTAEELNAIGRNPRLMDAHFKLISDINLDYNLPGRNVFDKAVIAPPEFLENDRLVSIPFTGVFNGYGHVISNLTIEGESYLGLFGFLGDRAEVKNLGVVDVNITGSGYYVGGLVGRNGVWLNEGGILINCYTTGIVSGETVVGGLVGYNDEGRITNCYSTSAVSGHVNGGGLLGYNDEGRITNCYSTGKVNGDYLADGFVGSNYYGDVTGCFWDIETSGQVTSDGGKGLTTAEMQTASTFLDAGWDFTNETANGTEDIWRILEGQDYPRLWWEQIEE